MSFTRVDDSDGEPFNIMTACFTQARSFKEADDLYMKSQLKPAEDVHGPQGQDIDKKVPAENANPKSDLKRKRRRGKRQRRAKEVMPAKPSAEMPPAKVSLKSATPAKSMPSMGSTPSPPKQHLFSCIQYSPKSSDSASDEYDDETGATIFW